MIYVLIGVIVLLVIILVAMGIALWQGKDYVYTREEFEVIKESYDETVKDRNKIITSLQGKLKDKNQVFNTSYDFLNQLIDEERRNSFKFENKYNVGEKISYVKDGKVYFGTIKTITTELFKGLKGVKNTNYIYLLENGSNINEESILTKQ